MSWQFDENIILCWLLHYTQLSERLMMAVCTHRPMEFECWYNILLWVWCQWWFKRASNQLSFKNVLIINWKHKRIFYSGTRPEAHHFSFFESLCFFKFVLLFGVSWHLGSWYTFCKLLNLSISYSKNISLMCYDMQHIVYTCKYSFGVLRFAAQRRNSTFLPSLKIREWTNLLDISSCWETWSTHKMFKFFQ